MDVRRSLEARLAGVNTHSQQRLSAVASLWRDLESVSACALQPALALCAAKRYNGMAALVMHSPSLQALEISQRAALRLACWPLLPDPVELAQRLTQPSAAATNGRDTEP